MPSDPWAGFKSAQEEKDQWSDFKPAQEEAAPETPFPTPGQTAGRVAMGALKAIPAMVTGTVQAAAAPFRPGYGVNLMRQTGEHLGKAFGAGPAGAGERLGEAVEAVPLVGPAVMGAVRGGQEIATPLAKTIVSGVGTVTPEEMNTAADTGGAAITNIAATEIARGGVAVAGKITPSMGKLLKFAPPAAVAMAGHPVAAAKMLMKGALTEAVLKPMGNIVIDHVLERIAARDAEGAAAVLARGLEKSPEAAKTLASALEEQANKVAPPGAPTFSPTDGSPAAVAARNAAKRARLGRPPADAQIVAPAANADPWRGITAETPEVIAAREAGKSKDWSGWGPQSSLKRPAFVDEAQGVNLPPDTSMPPGYPRGGPPPNVGPWEDVTPAGTVVPTPVVRQVIKKLGDVGIMPEKGNVKLPTVYTKPGPKVKPVAGESPAAKALAERQKAVASPDAIREAFGETPKGTPHGKKGPSGAPLTAAERKAALIKLQESIASGEDIFAAFGMEN